MLLSTSRLADLAGVTRRTIRHYHSAGLLPEPRRMPNGYKVYAASDLIVLLRIRRLTSLGFSLASIAERLAEGSGSAVASVAELDEVLELQIQRLQAIREEIAFAELHDIPLDVDPRAFQTAAHFSRRNQLNIAVLLSSAFSAAVQSAFDRFTEQPMDDYVDLVEAFEGLDETSTREDIDQVVIRVFEALNEMSVSDLLPDSHSGPNWRKQELSASRIFVKTLMDDFNPAQQEVLEVVLAHYAYFEGEDT